MTWWKQAVCYEICIRSFQDSNGDGIGDLNGIASRLDYLSDPGIDAIWITPFYPSPQVDFGYDVSDYENVDPQFGTLDDFDRLVAAAHARGMRVIVDIVLNHTSDRHPWFAASRSSRSSPYRDWYIWRDGRERGEPPNNWESAFGGPAWTFDERKGQWYYHFFYAEQPDLNWRNPAVEARMFETLAFWLDRASEEVVLISEAYVESVDDLVRFYGNGDEMGAGARRRRGRENTRDAAADAPRHAVPLLW